MTDPLTDLLARGRTDVDTAVVRAEAASLADVVRRSAPRRRPRRRIAIGLATALVAVPGTAMAYELGARTGLFGDPASHTEDVDGSEWLNICSPELASITAGMRPDGSPLPAGLTWSMAADHVVAISARACAEDGSILQQETGVRRQLNYWAQCAWLRDGVAAIDAGDAIRREEAARHLRHYATTEVNRVTDGGGIVEQDLAVADAVGRGDAAPARDQVSLNCGEFGVAR